MYSVDEEIYLLQKGSSKIAISPYKQPSKYHQIDPCFSYGKFAHLRNQCYSKYQSPSNFVQHQRTYINILVTETIPPVILKFN